MVLSPSIRSCTLVVCRVYDIYDLLLVVITRSYKFAWSVTNYKNYL